MKMIDIFKYIILENSQERFDLEPTTSVDSMALNFLKIAGGSGNHKIVVEWAMDYAMEFPEIGKQLMKKYKINDRNDFKKFIEKLQIKARKGINAVKNKDREDYKQFLAQFKADYHLADIEKMVMDQSAEWDERIANMK